MNWMLISVAMIFLVSIIIGLWKGAIKITVSLLTTVLVMALVFFITPYVTGFISKATPVESIIENQITESTMKMAAAFAQGDEEDAQMNASAVGMALKAAGVSEKDLEEMGFTIQDIIDGKVTSDDLAANGISRNVLSGALMKDMQAVDESQLNELPRDVQISAINSSELPAVFKNLLLENNNDEIYQKLGAEGFVSYVSKYLSKLIVNVVAFLFTFIIVTIIVRAIVLALDIISNLPVLGLVNRLAGGVLGVGGALIIVWILFVIITLLYSTNIGSELLTMIQDSAILAKIYEYNPIMKLATTFQYL